MNLIDSSTVCSPTKLNVKLMEQSAKHAKMHHHIRENKHAMIWAKFLPQTRPFCSGTKLAMCAQTRASCKLCWTIPMIPANDSRKFDRIWMGKLLLHIGWYFLFIEILEEYFEWENGDQMVRGLLDYPANDVDSGRSQLWRLEVLEISLKFSSYSPIFFDQNWTKKCNVDGAKCCASL